MDQQYPVTSSINNLRFDHNGQVFLLHHSNADIEVGDSVRASGTLTRGQTTAGDTTRGYSYAWDTADIESVSNAASNQAGARNIYLTTANPDDVLPDINVVGSSARAVRGDLPVIDRVTIPPNVDFGSREARSMIYDMLGRHGIPLGTSEEGKLVNAAYILARGEEAQKVYTNSRTEMQALSWAEKFDNRIAAGDGPPGHPDVRAKFDLYQEKGVQGLTDKLIDDLDGPVPGSDDANLRRMLEAGEAKGFSGRALSEIPRENLKKGFSALVSTSNVGIDSDPLPNWMPGQSIYADTVKKNIAESQRVRAASRVGRLSQTSQLLEAGSTASRSVAARSSAGMRLAGAAATIFRKRIF